MIAAVTTVKDEADIIGHTVRNMLAQGIDHVWVMDWQSTDDTRAVLADLDSVTVVTGSPLPFYWAHQPNYIGRLSDIAGDDHGAEWVIPFDADEYWTGTHGRTIAEALKDVPADRVHADIHQYVDFDHRSTLEYPWSKVAYRYRPGIRVVPGNHFVVGGYGPPGIDVLEVHELKFRGFEHFVRKCQRRIPWTPDSLTQPGASAPHLAIGGGEHISSELTREELRVYWNWLNEESEEMPIPSEFRP